MTPRARRIASWTALALVLAGAAFLRGFDLGRRGFCHPENYVPGLAVPPWVHDPPERTDLPSLAKSLLRDAHPPLYYLVMLPWVKAFGYTEVSIRVPSVMFGVASVLLLFLVALREARRETALVAAALLALHGQQIYWSQTARVYAFAIFLCLLSTWLLWKALETGRRGWRAAYALSAIAALWTHVYCWPVILCQALWSSLRAVRTKTAPVMLGSQIAAVIVSMPVIALAIYLYRPIVSTDPPLEYLELGYLFWSGAIPGESFILASNPTHLLVLAIGVAAVALGLLVRPKPLIAGEAPPTESHPALRVVVVLAAGVAAVIVAAASKAFRPGTPQFVKLLVVAALTLLLGLGFAALDSWIRRSAARDRGLLPWLAARCVRLSPVLALIPWLVLVAGSQVESAFLERGTMLYVPFLLLVAATGLTPPGRARWIAMPLLVAVLLLHSGSVRYAKHTDHTFRDYRGLAADLKQRLGKDDLILITNEYSDPPILYYLQDRYGQFVSSDWKKAVEARATGAVWIIRYEDQEVTPELRAAVEGLRPGEGVSVRGARALLYVR